MENYGLQLVIAYKFVIEKQLHTTPKYFTKVIYKDNDTESSDKTGPAVSKF